MSPKTGSPSASYDPKVVTVLENEYVALWYHPDSKIVHHKILKFPAPGVFRDLLSAGAECMEKYGASKWLSDDRDSPIVRVDDTEWGESIWGPRVIRAGFKYWAIVQPSKASSRLQMKRLTEFYRKKSVTVQMIRTVEEAMAWLNSVE